MAATTGRAPSRSQVERKPSTSPVHASKHKTAAAAAAITSSPNPYTPPSEVVTRRVPQADIDKAVARLAQSPPRRATPDPLAAYHVSRPSSVIEQSVVRLYKASLEHRDKTREDLEKKILVDKRPKNTMTPDEANESLTRLYYGRIKQVEETHQRLREKYLAQPPIMAKGKEKVDHAIQHLYYTERERAVSRQQKLREQYVEHTGPHVPRLPAADISGVVARLTKPKDS